MTREEIKQVKMTNQEAIEILRDTPIDLRSPREDDIHTLYAKAQMMAIEALQERPKGRWIDTGYKNSTGNIYKCSNCEGFHNPNEEDIKLNRVKEKPNFCPNCGASMGESEQE